MGMKRRQFERHAFRLPVHVRWEAGEGGGGDVRTTSRTLGLGGLFLALDPAAPPSPVGTRLTLTLTLAHQRRRDEVVLQAEVVYVEPGGVGVRFVDTPPDVRARLRAFFLLQDLHCYNTEPQAGP
jgi:PilZ domain